MLPKYTELKIKNTGHIQYNNCHVTLDSDLRHTEQNRMCAYIRAVKMLQTHLNRKHNNIHLVDFLFISEGVSCAFTADQLILKINQPLFVIYLTVCAV